MEETWDCVVVGGGAAGLSAGLVLGRARRRTLLVDAGEQSNLAAEGVGGLLGNDRRPPAELYAAGREEIGRHPSVEIRSGEKVLDARAEGSGFELELGDGSRIQSRKLLLAPGVEYRPPDLPGLRERWGGAVFHCPFCHGWEVREGRLGLLGGGEGGVQKALLLRAWSDDVTLLTDGEDLPSAQLTRLESAGVKLEERPVEGLGKSAPAAVRFGDGSELDLDGLLVTVSMHQRSPLASRLGLEFAPQPLREETIAVDLGFETSVPGVYAAGDVCVPMPSVASAIASGSTAAARIVHALMEEAAE
ncbi:MAG: NAD(P)/FAD-dependent oxidoreductase [Actinomycetota bacterium]|nr:NAD(P)/FAD-dependent oxidoreductase [Actinomycetota bacterium]